MAQSFDLILKGGTVVNHDGRAERDVGIRDGRIVALGDLPTAAAGETTTAPAPSPNRTQVARSL